MTVDNDSRSDGPETGQEQIVAGYQSLLERLSRMVDSARQGEYSFLVEQKTGYLAEMEWLHRLERGITLDGKSRQQKGRLVHRILQYSAELQKLLIERRDVLTRLVAEDASGAGDAFRDPPSVQGNIRGDEERFDRELR